MRVEALGDRVGQALRDAAMLSSCCCYHPSVGELLSAPASLGETEETLSLDEKLRRERRRAYTLGITTYAWAPVGDRLLIPLQVGRQALETDCSASPLRPGVGGSGEDYR